jgi:biopolymer transport protein ExbD
MRRRKRRRLIQEIPQASLPDMAFLLLIFFISATVFGVEHGLPLVLPSAKRSPRISVEPTEVFRIQARADGAVMAEDRVVQVAEIEALLRARNAERLAQQQSELIVIVETHPDAAYELMVSILDQIRAAGSRRVALRSLEE